MDIKARVSIATAIPEVRTVCSALSAVLGLPIIAQFTPTNNGDPTAYELVVYSPTGIEIGYTTFERGEGSKKHPGKWQVGRSHAGMFTTPFIMNILMPVFNRIEEEINSVTSRRITRTFALQD
jgi:hypothetical protein